LQSGWGGGGGGAIAVDETVLKMGGRRLYVWAAVDAHSREVLAIRASINRMDLDALAFLRTAQDVQGQAPHPGG